MANSIVLGGSQMMNAKRDLVGLLARHAYTESDVRLSSGDPSSVYLDAKKVTHLPAGVWVVGRAVLNEIQPYRVSAIGGLATGANAIVTSVTFAANEIGLDIPGFFVREAGPKGHGLRKEIEGVPLTPGMSVAVVDDVVTTGRSVIKAIDALERSGIHVRVVVALTDREHGGRANIEARGIDFRPLCTLADIAEARQEQERQRPQKAVG